MCPKVVLALVAAAKQAGCATPQTKPPDVSSDLFIRSLMTSHAAEPQPAPLERAATRSEER